MGMKHFNPYTPSRRNMTVSTFDEITKKTPEKSLLAKKKENAERNRYVRLNKRNQCCKQTKINRIIRRKFYEKEKYSDQFSAAFSGSRNLVLCITAGF